MADRSGVPASSEGGEIAEREERPGRHATVSVNGVVHALAGEGSLSLLAFLRERLGLTGAKPGCGEGVCGACTVLVDGEPARSCVLPVELAAGRSVATVEGLASGGVLHPLQQAFIETGALQCGYCAAGMLMSAAALLARTPEPSQAERVAALEGVLCRCCAYPALTRALDRAVELGRERDPEPHRTGEGGAPARARPTLPWSSLPLERRDYFAVLPAGLVVVSERPQPPDGWATCDEAWLHLGADGSVTAFCGKVDVGQGISAALAALVAEELRLAPEAVSLVLGDTDLCPHDLGTFGSRSLPDAAPLLAAAAAAARGLLLELAAARLKAPLAQLEAAQGAVSFGRLHATYAELLTGLERVERAPATSLTPPALWRVAGRPLRKPDALGLVTGALHFPSDQSRPDMLSAALLRPPSAAAQPILAHEAPADGGAAARLLVSDGIVAALAADEPAARAALAGAQVRWQAAGPAQPALAESGLAAHLRSHPAEPTGFWEAFDHASGDVEAALAAAPVRLEATYETAFIAHAPLETRAALAEWQGERLTVWTGSQRPFAVREQLALEFGLDEDQVRVVAPRAGGGFGGKHSGEAAVQAARLARLAGRPVKLRWSRGEEFRYGYSRPAAVIDVRCGARPDGSLLAWDFLDINAGAAGIESPYRSETLRLRFQPAQAPLAQGSYRALAATANTFARESHIDELACRVGRDPVELRLGLLDDARLAAVLSATAERAGWGSQASGDGFGVGIAAGVEKDARVATCAGVRVEASGAISVLGIVTALDCGAIVDPANLRNQVEGATVMGLGGALFEALHFADGVIANAALASYRVPRFSDVPPIEVLLLDRRDIPPAGAGETPIVAVAPAVANAIRAATGLRRCSLPLDQAPPGVQTAR